jgi:hypothetical protein
VDVEDPLVVTLFPVKDIFSLNQDDEQEPLALRQQNVAIFDYSKWGSSLDDKFEGSISYNPAAACGWSVIMRSVRERWLLLLHASHRSPL